MDSEDFLLFSRNEPLHPLLDVLVENDEEDGLLSSKLRTQRERVIPWFNMKSNSFCSSEQFLMKTQQVLFFVVLLLPLIGLQNPSHSVVKLVLQADLQGTSVSLLFESITNLFDP